MSALPEPLQKITREFERDIDALFGDRVLSLIVYGSAATEEYAPKKSDVNILVVLDEEGIQNLQPVHEKIAGWHKHKLHPLFLTEDYIDQSLDSFPIEFLNMKSAYRVLKGKDVLQPLEFDRRDLRLQCERELKGNLLHLRQRFILTRGKKIELLRLIKESVVAFTAIFRALLFLKGRDIPSDRESVIRQACADFEIDPDLFSKLIAIRGGSMKPAQAELRDLIDAYIRQIRSLSQYVDAMQL